MAGADSYFDLGFFSSHIHLHLLGALQRFGKMGMTCIAPTLEEADILYDQAVETLGLPPA